MNDKLKLILFALIMSVAALGNGYVVVRKWQRRRA